VPFHKAGAGSNPASVATAMASIAVPKGGCALTGSVVTKHYYFGNHRRWFAFLDHTAQMPERATPCARLDKFRKRGIIAAPSMTAGHEKPPGLIDRAVAISLFPHQFMIMS